VGVVTGEGAPSSLRGRYHYAAALGLSLGVATAYSLLSLSRHAQGLTAGFDLGIFSQAVQRYARIEAPVAELKGVDFNVLGDHFHPIVAVLAPAWWAWPDPRVLLVAQALLIAASLPPVLLMASNRMPLIPALLFAAGYAFSWPIQGMAGFDFHEIAFAVPLLAWSLYLYDSGKIWAAFWMSVPLLGVREDMFLVFLAFATLSLVQRHKAAAAAWAGAGVTWGFFVFVVAIPALSPYGRYTYLDAGNGVGADRSPVGLLLAAVTPPEKIAGVLLLLLPLLLLPLLSPYSLLAVPFLAERLLTDREAMWGTQFHYSSVFAPVLAVAALDGLGRLQKRLPGRSSRHVYWALAVSTICWAFVGTAAAPATYPLNSVLTGEAFQPSAKASTVQAALERIPKSICLEADNRLSVQALPGRVVSLPGESNGEATWLVLDLDAPDVGRRGDTPQSELEKARSRGFSEVFLSGGIVVLNRPGRVSDRCASG